MIHSTIYGFYVIIYTYKFILETISTPLYLFFFSKKSATGNRDPRTFESAEFPVYMTPLMLACIENCYEIVQMLIQKGHDVIVPEYVSGRYCHNQHFYNCISTNNCQIKGFKLKEKMHAFRHIGRICSIR